MTTAIREDLQPVVLAEGLDFPEGPAFDQKGNLWLVELKGGNLAKFDGQAIKRYPTGGNPNGVAIDKHDNIWFCDSGQRSVRVFHEGTRAFKTAVSTVDDESLNKPNDLAFDPLGNLVFTCPGESRRAPTGYVCALTQKGDIKKIASEKYFPNGLAFSAGGRVLVVAETYKHRIWKGDWDPQRQLWTNTHVFAEVGGPIGPDGMAFDESGNLYVAVYGSGKIKVVNPTGKLMQEITLPGSNPTNCAFDPSGNLGLVVTEAEKGCLLSIPVRKNGLELFRR